MRCAITLSPSRATGQRAWAQPVKFSTMTASTIPRAVPTSARGSRWTAPEAGGTAALYTGAGSASHPGVSDAQAFPSPPGKRLLQARRLLSDACIPYGDVKLALDAKDNAWVAFEDRRGDEDLIQVAMIAPDGRHTLAETWPGTAPDVAAEDRTAIVAWGTQGQGDAEAGGGINTRVLSLPEVP